MSAGKTKSKKEKFFVSRVKTMKGKFLNKVIGSDIHVMNDSYENI